MMPTGAGPMDPAACRYVVPSLWLGFALRVALMALMAVTAGARRAI
jgi:hypothetical protein